MLKASMISLICSEWEAEEADKLNRGRNK